MSEELELPFRPDDQLTEVMRLRVQSLQQRGQKRQDGERLLQPNEAVFRLDFSKQSLRFSHWTVQLAQPGRLTITATSQLWTPDLTNLMTRQLLEPAGVFWRGSTDGNNTNITNNTNNAAVQCYEADAHEFGERIAELAKVRKVMYFLFAFAEGCSPETVDCSITFTVDS
ncbi:olfactory marker protein b [Halichoeres trimaculatus]|uniref:olfactory marker protein b n=1 Tax=Halichoeres trimaculatus TaxID=147232 RepID=UPI003D9EC83C